MKQKILFITRNYPPKLGGLETYSYNLIREFEKCQHVTKIVLSKSNINLLWFLPYSLFKALFVTWRHSIRHIHLCDGLLSPIGILLKLVLGARVTVSIHGLDITYHNFFYQLLIPRCIARLDKIISVSRTTRSECKRRNIPVQKCVIIPNGIRPDDLYLSDSIDDLRSKLEKITGRALNDRKILVTVGRLVKRKGVSWFIDCVIPRLNSSYIYLVAGEGPEFYQIQQVVLRRKMESRVILLGRVSNDLRKILYNASDIFIMPNMTVANDIEGFGIAIIEAGSCGLPVVASNLQGIKDAVIDKKTGYLVDEGDIDGFLGRIRSMNLNKDDIRSYVTAKFNWTTIYRSYQDAIFESSSRMDSNELQ
ncbi:MAG: glycosyltransferase family 4 protein [Deltaproteobacteria bacterium]|nr:glycosyltransferase family 4 protein [Deltaproteobacteria bacterium]